MRKLMLAGVVLATGLNAGCTWVEATPSGSRVSVMTQQQAYNCEKLGTTRQTGVSKVGFIERDDKKVSEELTTLARNSAAEMGGNAIVPINQPVDGKQVFAVFRCPNL